MANFFQTSNVQKDPDQLSVHVPTVSTPIASSIGGDIINGQTAAADYDNVGNNGTFTAGSGYVVDNVIELSDGSKVTVTSVSTGAVTGFTVTTVGGANTAAAATLTQSAVTGGASQAGTNFDLTTGTDNISAAITADEIIIDWDLKKIGLVVQGNLGDDGASLKAIYSSLKDAWQSDALLIKFPFPMGPITDEQFEMINGWNWDKVETSGTVSATTIELIRDGGWSVKDTSNVIQEEWAAIISLGILGATDQVYYQQVQDETSTTNTFNFKQFGAVNQAVQMYENGGADYRDQTGATNILKLFVREWQSTYGTSRFSDIGVSSVTYQAYRFPLTSQADLKVPHLEGFLSGGVSVSASSDGTIHTYTTPSAHGLAIGEVLTITGFTSETDFNETTTAILSIPSDTTFTMTPTVATANSSTDTGGSAVRPSYDLTTITYVRDANGDLVTNDKISGATHTTGAGDYAIGDVIQEAGEWYINKTGVNTATAPPSDPTNWEVFAGSREIAGTNYPFTVIIDGDTNVAGEGAGGVNTTVDIYEKVQYFLRQNSDIDADGTGTVVGKTGDSLLRFVGDTLVTASGVYIDSFAEADTNAIEFVDAQNGTRLFNFLATLNVNFGSTLQDDEFAKFFVFFENDLAATSPEGKNYNTPLAVIVQDKDSTPISGLVNPSWPTKRASATFSYDYDGNVQRGAGSASTPAPIIVVALGLNEAQYVSSAGTINRSKSNIVSLIAALERNYDEGTV